MVKELIAEFDGVSIRHIPRERNARADLLSKIVSTKSISANRSLIQEAVKTPSVATTFSTNFPLSNKHLRTFPILRFLIIGDLPEDPKEAKRVKREATKYTTIAGQLYKRGLSQPFLKCEEPGETDYILREFHEGCCDHHIGGKTLAQNVIRARYF
ncbi:uncharacterized protein [Arachis hypogaea]|uniref:uncharacterized protein n=1 Tax=Arachis hypogaea TaxID=3818 RepID=UPI003B20B9CA